MVGHVRGVIAAGVTVMCAAAALSANAGEIGDGRIAFAGSDKSTGSHELYSTLPDGSDRINLTRRFGADAMAPIYAPDGRWIAFSCTDPGDEREPFPTDVCVVKDGAERPRPVRLVHRKGIDVPSGFSPNGKWILFNGSAAKGKSAVYVIKRNGGGLTRLTDPQVVDSVSRATFTPDGRQILFAEFGGGIYLMDRDGSNLTRVIDDSTADSAFYVAFRPAMSPDGTRIVFLAYPRGDEDESDRELFVSDLQGGNVVRLTDDAGNQKAATFSPDGDLIAYALGGSIWTVRPDGSENRIAVDGGAFDLDQVGWAPSGSRLVFQMSGDGSEIGTAATGEGAAQITDTARVDEGSPAWAPQP